MGRSSITANRLRDGVVVWLDAKLQWTERMSDAAVHEDSAAKTMLTDPKVNDALVVVDVREVPVDIASGTPEPVARRERLRGAGPSVREDLVETSPGRRWAERGPSARAHQHR